MGSLLLRCSRMALAMPRLPSAFSKSMGLTLCGMAEEPISPALVFCLKSPCEMYVQMSRARSTRITLTLLVPSNSAAMLS
eukprot:713134-Hanusia_phi.AAC.1